MFNVPTFNLLCNVWSFATPPPGLRRAQFPCNLAYSRRVHESVSGGSADRMSLLLPAKTDIRGPLNAGHQDYVEVPAGTGRFYQVVDVDDVGRGFGNEFRCAVLLGTVIFGFWPTPIP